MTNASRVRKKEIMARDKKSKGRALNHERIIFRQKQEQRERERGYVLRCNMVGRGRMMNDRDSPR